MNQHSFVLNVLTATLKARSLNVVQLNDCIQLLDFNSILKFESGSFYHLGRTTQNGMLLNFVFNAASGPVEHTVPWCASSASVGRFDSGEFSMVHFSLADMLALANAIHAIGADYIPNKLLTYVTHIEGAAPKVEQSAEKGVLTIIDASTKGIGFDDDQKAYLLGTLPVTEEAKTPEAPVEEKEESASFAETLLRDFETHFEVTGGEDIDDYEDSDDQDNAALERAAATRSFVLTRLGRAFPKHVPCADVMDFVAENLAISDEEELLDEWAPITRDILADLPPAVTSALAVSIACEYDEDDFQEIFVEKEGDEITDLVIRLTSLRRKLSTKPRKHLDAVLADNLLRKEFVCKVVKELPTGDDTRRPLELAQWIVRRTSPDAPAAAQRGRPVELKLPKLAHATFFKTRATVRARERGVRVLDVARAVFGHFGRDVSVFGFADGNSFCNAVLDKANKESVQIGHLVDAALSVCEVREWESDDLFEVLTQSPVVVPCGLYIASLFDIKLEALHEYGASLKTDVPSTAILASFLTTAKGSFHDLLGRRSIIEPMRDDLFAKMREENFYDFSNDIWEAKVAK